MYDKKYFLIEGTYKSENLEYTGYGLKYVSFDGEIQLNFEDICIERNRMLSFIEICNRLELSPIHINDVIEDLLADIIYNKK